MEILFGIIAGIVSGMGMGGGAILIMLLSVFMNLEQHVAQAINLVFFVPTSVAAIFVNKKQKIIDFKLAGIIILFGIIGAIIGASIAQKISSNYLRKYFAIFILIIAIHEIYDIYRLYIKK